MGCQDTAQSRAERNGLCTVKGWLKEQRRSQDFNVGKKGSWQHQQQKLGRGAGLRREVDLFGHSRGLSTAPEAWNTSVSRTSGAFLPEGHGMK